VAKIRAAADPAWASTTALQAAAVGNVAGVLAGGKAALLEVVIATHSGMNAGSCREGGGNLKAA
jgi:hypothetical protein